MAKQGLNIVWLKRDLRTQDHAPFQAASKEDLPFLAIYIFEPKLIDYPDCSLRHLQFVYHSLGELNKTLQPFNINTEIFQENAEVVAQAEEEQKSQDK